MNSLPKKRLGDIMTLHRGFDLPSSERIDGDIPVIGSSGICGSHNTPKLDGQSVITGRYGTIGKVFYHKVHAGLSTQLFMSRTFMGITLDTSLIYYSTRSIRYVSMAPIRVPFLA